MRLLLIGPPGSGKGTQAVRVGEALGVPEISTGDIFRANVAAETPVGVEARKYMLAGEYVPDDVTNAMVRARLQEPDVAHGWLLDGYPRTVAQVHELDDIAGSTGHSLDVVLALEVDEEELIRRLRQRALDENRADDTEEVIRHRQLLYREQTAPVLAAYDERSLLSKVDGDGDVDDVTRRLLDTLRAGSFLQDT
jgi:adenylate kinase